MTSEWTELRDLNEVAIAQKSKWEIEHHSSNYYQWEPWDGTWWNSIAQFRGRPAQPKTKIVTSECWRNGCNGNLAWTNPEYQKADGWQRFPAGDITGEVRDE